MHQVGVGVLGPVFRTYDPNGDRLVAVKAFQLDLVPEQVEVFVGALERVAEVGPAHSGVVSALGAGVEDGIPYLALEYVATESLDVLIRQEAPLQLRKVVNLVHQIATAIDAAHAVGVVHGAIHLRDIFVSPEGARATGFGVASALEHVGLKVSIRPPYTAPEIVAGRRWGPEADRFSVAAIAYELLTGRRAAGTGDEVLARLIEFDTADVADPVGLQQAFRNALADDPEIRPVSATGFVSALVSAVGIEVDVERDDIDVTDALERDRSFVALTGARGRLSEFDESAAVFDKSESQDEDLVVEQEVRTAEEELIQSSRNNQEDLFDWLIDKPQPSTDESDAVAGAELGVGDADVGPSETGSDTEPTDSDETRRPVTSEVNENAVQVNDPDDSGASSQIASAQAETTREVEAVIESVADATPTLDTDWQTESGVDKVETPEDFVSEEQVEVVAADYQMDGEPKQTPGSIHAPNRLSEEPRREVEQAAFSGLVGDASSADAEKDAVMPGRIEVDVPTPATAFLRGRNVSRMAPTSSRKVVPIAIAVVVGVSVAYLLSIGLGSGDTSVNNGVASDAISPVETTSQVSPVTSSEQRDVEASDAVTTEVPSEEAGEGVQLGIDQSPSQNPSAVEGEQAFQLAEEPETETELTPTGQEVRPVSDSADSESGWLLVRTEPPGAVVSVDGEVGGDSPISIANVSYGTYRLAVAAEGYQPVERVVTITADQRVVAVNVLLMPEAGNQTVLSRQTEAGETSALVGRLFVDSRPPGATVFVGATQVGMTPILVPDVTVGSHRVRIEGTGYLPWITTVAIESNEEVRVAASLEPGVRR